MIARSKQYGLTLVEVLVAMALLALLLVPAISALQTTTVGANVHRDLATDQFRLSSRLDELLAEPFAELEAAAIAAGAPINETSYSETAGAPGRLVVYLSRCDGDNADSDNNIFTGADDGMLWIRVEAEGTVHSLQTITARGF
jgi:prepilin-type N-terminal cleavage/methylation domain-containing protein